MIHTSKQSKHVIANNISFDFNFSIYLRVYLKYVK